MNLKTHRRHATHYELAIETPDGEVREFTWAVTLPEGVTRKDYEASMQREAALLVKAELEQASEGKPVKGEGSDLSNVS